MLRRRAVRSILIEQVAALRPPGTGDARGGEEREGEDGTGAPLGSAEAPGASVPTESELESELASELEALAQAERRAKLVVLLDWAALAVLFVLRDTAAPFLPLDGTIETVFTLGVLAVAVHSGFRLGQLEKYRAVRRAHDALR